MIRCKPMGICSWNYILEGEGHQGTLQYQWIGEQGKLTIDGIGFEIVKRGTFSGSWTLNHGGNEVCWARKSSVFTRGFTIEDPSGNFDLTADSAFGRSFRLQRHGELIAFFRPQHPFTRRASIEVLAEQFDLPTVYFSFWLVALMWRRAENSG